MRTAIGLILFFGGMALALYGLGSAILELVGLYSSTLSAPLDNPPGGGEQAVSQRMLHSAILGACGIPPMIVGSVMLGVGLWGRLRRRFGQR